MARAGTMSPFVNLGPARLTPQSRDFTFSQPPPEPLFGPPPPQHTASGGQSQFVMRPFTVFNIGLPVQHQVQHGVQVFALGQPSLEPGQTGALDPVATQHVVQTEYKDGQQADLFSSASRDLTHVTTLSDPVPATSHEQISPPLTPAIIEQEFSRTEDDDVLTNIVPTSGGTNTNDKPFNIFEYISRPTSNRQARQKVNTKKMKKMGKMDALKILMKIAGDHWERDLMMGSKAERGSSSTAGETVDFVCPSSEGHFPDPAQCDVYYQCAGGAPHRYSCHSGLQWNIYTNQCDWANSVDCSLNTQFYSGARP